MLVNSAEASKAAEELLVECRKRYEVKVNEAERKRKEEEERKVCVSRCCFCVRDGHMRVRMLCTFQINLPTHFGRIGIHLKEFLDFFLIVLSHDFCARDPAVLKWL